MTEPTTPQPGMAPAQGAMPAGPSENLLRHYATVLRRRWRWIMLGVVVGIVAGGAAAVLIKPKPVTVRYYKATNTLVRGTSNSPTVGDYTLSDAVLQVQSQELIDQVAQDLDLNADDIAERLSAGGRPDVNAIDVTAIAQDPQQAIALADASAAALRVRAQAQAGSSTDAKRVELEAQLDQLTDDWEALQANVNEDDDAATQLLATQQLQEVEASIRSTSEELAALPDQDSGFRLTELQPATAIQINARGYNYRRSQNLNARNKLVETNRNDAGPDFDENDLSTDTAVSPRNRVLLGGAAGLVLGLLSAFLIEAWDDRVRRRDRVEELTGLGVLTAIPRMSRDETRNHHIAVEDEPTGVAAERFRSARTAINFAMTTADATDHAVATPVLMVTSPNPSEGKTTTVANLAASFAGDGRNVLIVDGDFRRPTVRRYLAPVPNLISPDEPCSTRVDGVEFLPGPHDAGSPELAIESLAATVAKWRGHYDLIVLDTPPILTTNDGVELLGSADAVVLVLRAGRTRTRAAQRVAELLRQFHADTLGVVLNDCDRAEMNEYYGYGYGYLNSPTASLARSRGATDVDADTTRPDTPNEVSQTATADGEPSVSISNSSD